MAVKERKFYLDLIRVLALACILVIHFEAEISGMFSRIPSYMVIFLPGGIYLGDLGTTLFFMVSGCALTYVYPPDMDVKRYLGRRIKAVYPLFYLSYAICFLVQILLVRDRFAGIPLRRFLYTVFGMDMFAMSIGWTNANFALVGEWFLGAIILIYPCFPLLRKMVAKRPYFTVFIVAAFTLGLHQTNFDRGLVFIHLLEFTMGMLAGAEKFDENRKVCGITAAVLALAFVVLTVGPVTLPAKVRTVLMGGAVFCLAALAARYLDREPLRRAGKAAADISYPVFLLHHFILRQMVRFTSPDDLPFLRTFLVFLLYLLLTFVFSMGLSLLDSRLRKLRPIR